jgi:hypothetical protein
MAGFLLAKDTISGREGQVIAVIEGRVKTFAHIKSLTAKIDKQKSPVNTLGGGTQHKSTGTNNTGSMKYYYGDTSVAKMIVEYLRTGRDIYFDIIVVNDDPSSAAGTQRIKLVDVNLDGAEIAKIDVDATTAMDVSANFTFRTAEILDEFREIV